MEVPDSFLDNGIARTGERERNAVDQSITKMVYRLTRAEVVIHSVRGPVAHPVRLRAIV